MDTLTLENFKYRKNILMQNTSRMTTCSSQGEITFYCNNSSNTKSNQQFHTGLLIVLLGMKSGGSPAGEDQICPPLPQGSTHYDGHHGMKYVRGWDAQHVHQQPLCKVSPSCPTLRTHPLVSLPRSHSVDWLLDLCSPTLSSHPLASLWHLTLSSHSKISPSRLSLRFHPLYWLLGLCSTTLLSHPLSSLSHLTLLSHSKHSPSSVTLRSHSLD